MSGNTLFENDLTPRELAVTDAKDHFVSEFSAFVQDGDYHRRALQRLRPEQTHDGCSFEQEAGDRLCW